MDATMSQLTDVQINVLQEIYANDPEFRGLIQQRFAKEAMTVAERANRLRAVTEGFGLRKVVTQTANGKTRGRPKGPNGDTTKMDALRSFIEHNPGCNTKKILEALNKAGVEMDNKMLNSYLYQLKQNNEIEASGELGHRTYSIVAKPKAKV